VCQIRGVRWMGDDNHLVFRHKLLDGNGSVKRGVVVVKQPGLFSPKFGETSSHVFTQSPQNVAIESGIHSLVCWDLSFALPQLLYKWLHQSEIFWILPRTMCLCFYGQQCIDFPILRLGVCNNYVLACLR
jgi:hypothetical protein